MIVTRGFGVDGEIVTRGFNTSIVAAVEEVAEAVRKAVAQGGTRAKKKNRRSI